MSGEQDKNKEIWTWNYSESEIWPNGQFESKEDAIKEGKANVKSDDCDHFYIGRCQPVKAIAPHADWFIEQADSNLAELVGSDLAWEWSKKIMPADIDKLNRMIEQMFETWLKETDNEPQCYQVVDIERIEVD